MTVLFLTIAFFVSLIQYVKKTQGCLQRERSYYGSWFGKPLADWLNRDAKVFGKALPPKAAVQRIEKLIQLVKDVSPPGGQGQLNRERWSELVATIKPYRFRLKLVFGREGLQPQYIAIGRASSTNEGHAIWPLFELCKRGLHHRMRLCVWCKRWLYARFNHETHCYERPCRKEELAKSDRWKEYRRQKSQDYYRDKKSGRKRREL